MSVIDSSTIHNWSEGPGASHELPALVRRLVMETTTEQTRVQMPSGSSVYQSGWDGLVEVPKGNIWVPSGLSAWEISTEKTPKRKADSLYESRTGNPLDIPVSTTTFVFVTSRKWPGKTKWVDERLATCPWAGVKVLDADDLVAWLEQAEKTSQFFMSLVLKSLGPNEAVPLDAERLTRDYFDTKFDSLKAALSIRSNPTVIQDDAPSSTLNSAFIELSAKIDVARDLVNAGRIDSARSTLEQLRSQHETMPASIRFRILSNIGNCALANDDFDEAIILLKESYELLPDTPQGIANAAFAAQLEKDAQRAVNMALKAKSIEQVNSQATAILISELWKVGDSEQLEELISHENWILDDEQCVLALVGVRVAQSRFEEAANLCRSLIQLNARDASYHLALSEVLLLQFQEDRITTGFSSELFHKLAESEKESSCAIALLRQTELKKRLQRARTVRGCVRAFLGQPTEAKLDFDNVLSEAPCDPDAAYNKGLLLLFDGEFQDARETFGRIEDAERRAYAILPLADACLASGDAPAAIELLGDDVTFECPGWDSVHRAAILFNAQKAVGADDSVGPVLANSLRSNRDNLFTLTLAAILSDDPHSAEDLLLEALEHAGGFDRRMILTRLGVHYQQQERFSEAADQFAEVADGAGGDPTALSLLHCLMESRRFGEALLWSRRIQEEIRQPPRFVINAEIWILEYVGDVQSAVSRLQELCSRDSAHWTDRVRLGLAQIRNGQLDAAADTILGVQSPALRDNPPAMMTLARLKLMLGIEGYLDDAYVARRLNPDDSNVQLAYVGLFLQNNVTLDDPKCVVPACAVLLKNDSVERWWNILDDGEEVRGPYDLHLNDELAQNLLGHSIGDLVELPEGIQNTRYEIAAIQNRFGRAFQETTEQFSARFPGNTGLFKVDIQDDAFTEILTDNDERSRRVENAYRQGEMALATCAAVLGHSTLELWHVCTAEEGIQLQFGTGLAEEMQEACNLLKETESVVIDFVALLTIHELGLAERVKRRFSTAAVPQRIIDELREIAFKPSLGEAVGTRANLQESARSVLNLAESFEPVASYPMLEIPDLASLVNTLTESGVSAIYAGNSQSSDDFILISDDLVLAGMARSLDVDTVNTQALLVELDRSGVITEDEYSLYIERLALLNYSFLQVRALDIIRRLAAHQYVTTKGTQALIGTLAHSKCSDDDVARIASELVSMMVGQIPIEQFQLKLSWVSGTIRHGREKGLVMLKFRDDLSDRLPPEIRNWVLGYLDDLESPRYRI